MLADLIYHNKSGYYCSGVTPRYNIHFDYLHQAASLLMTKCGEMLLKERLMLLHIYLAFFLLNVTSHLEMAKGLICSEKIQKLVA